MQQGYHQCRSRPAGELQLLSNENLLAKRDSEEYTKERNAEAPQYQLRNTEFQWPAFRWLEELFQRWYHTNETCAEWHRAHRYGNRLKKDCGIGLVVGKTGEGGGEIPFSTGVKGNSRYAAHDLNIANPMSEEGIDIIETHPA